MGIFNIGGGERKEIVKVINSEEILKEKKMLNDAAKRLAQRQRTISSRQTGYALGKQLGGFARPPQEDFSFQEQVLRETVGGRGEKIWGTIGEPVQINNDLNPRQRGDTSTGELFGF